MLNETFAFTIEKEMAVIQKGTFTVPSVCRHLCLEYELEPPFPFLIFLLLRDPNGKLRFQKQLGYSTPVICLGESGADTTIGGIPGAIPAGVWTVECYVFAEHMEAMVQERKIPFTLRITDRRQDIAEAVGGQVWADEDFRYTHYDTQTCRCAEARWYKGDFHTHTQLSDGKELPARANEKAQMMQLDYYVATEHNVLHTGWQETEVMIVPGVEITTTLGHANLFGLDRRPARLTDILRCKDREALTDALDGIVAECRERNWLFSINHPFLYVWKWLYEALPLDAVGCLEINNDPTYESDPVAQAREANQKAVYLSDLLWADGYRICAVGGSDSHKAIDDFYPGASEPSIPGDPATYLYMEGLSPAHLVQSLRDCRCYVTRHCAVCSAFEVLDEDGRTLHRPMFGDRIAPAGRTLRFTLTLSDTQQPPTVYAIHNGERRVYPVTETAAHTYQAQGEIALCENGYQWVRFGAEDESGAFLFYGNPLTRGSTEHRFRTFGEIRKHLEETWKSKAYYLTKTAP